MADFSALKTAIQANIRTNANEEITGAILQEVLLSMVTTMGDGAINGLVTALQEEVAARQNAVGSEATARQDADSALSGRINGEATARGEADTLLQNAINGINTKLAEGYIYVGIAIPSTNPSTPTGKVFYIALQGGTYTNFSGLTVTQGINILKYNGSAWSLEQLWGVDDVPTAGSNNPVKSGGVYARLNDYAVETELKGYIDNNGIFQSVPSGGWRSSDFIPVLVNGLSCKYSAIGSTGANLVSYYDENKNYISGVAYSDSERKTGTLTIPDNTAFIRVCTDSYTGQLEHFFYIRNYSLSSIGELIKDNNAINAVSNILKITKDDFALNGYLDGNGVVTANSDWKTTNKISVYNYNTLSLNCVIGLLAYGVFWGDNNNIVGTFQTSMTLGLNTIKIPAGTYYVQLTNNFTIFSNPYAYLKLNEEIVIDYENVVRKPFTFNGKHAIFVGDSITRGFVTSSYITPNGFPKLFSNKVGMTFENNGVGGACFVGGEVQTIPSQVEEADKDADFLFIAGGVNDWQNNTDYTTFETAISNLCTYINNNFAQTTNVIWITPINVGRIPYFKPTKELQKYRNIITEQVLENDTYKRFTILQGNKFMFPDEKGDLSLREAMFGDMLHPSELGYSWYAATLQTLLL